MKMKKKLILYLSGFLILALVAIIFIYRVLYGTSIQTKTSNRIIYIPTGSTYSQVLDTLKANLLIKNMQVLDWVARKKKYPGLIKPGRYVIDRKLSPNRLIN
jgi:UPF0755 protein